MVKVLDVLNYIFGANPKTRFRRILLTLIIVFAFVMGFLNLSCGIDKGGNWYIKWTPGAKIEVSK
jgi:uncharacterized membrane-anchored protein